MKSCLTLIERFILRKICCKLVRQDYYHQERITEYYRIMKEEAKKEFYEDNKATLNSFLFECFESAKDTDY